MKLCYEMTEMCVEFFLGSFCGDYESKNRTMWLQHRGSLASKIVGCSPLISMEQVEQWLRDNYDALIS
jgi:hypothetical protein